MLRKEKLVFIFLILCVHTFYAQEINKFKIGVELGPAKGADIAILAALEPKFSINENSTVGLRLGVAFLLGRNIEESMKSQYIIEEGFSLHEIYSLAATFDRYLGKANSRFQPFIGGGLSYYKLSGISYISAKDNHDVNLASTAKVKGQMGLLVRGGFEFGKFRLGLECNFISKSEIKTQNGEIAGWAKDSYFGVSLGGIIGGGKR